ncbi:MAG: GerMN domain-containing protein [Candidatus Paceibacterota bacterium]
MKKILEYKSLFLIVLVILSFTSIIFLIRGDEDTWICENGQWIKHGNPDIPMPSNGCVKDNKDTRRISLYFYNSKQDKDILCSPDAVLPVEREILLSQTPIQDAVNLLLEGKITQEEKEAGFSSEFPLEGIKLIGANLKDGMLTLEFNDPLFKTIGGSCRVGLLWNQIAKTAKQFEGVNEVGFFPEDLFQP